MDIKQLHDIFLECGSTLSTDSRNIAEGSLFVALKGENFDGNDFAKAALQKGAARCLVNEDSKAALCPDSRLICVPDTLKALQELASWHREHTLHEGKRIPVLALTGTNGKTTTKELIRSVLSRKYTLTATEGNLNNNIGVPLTLLHITADTQMAIIEMGASHPGDIKELVQIAHPDFGLITNVGRAHLLGFGSFDGVKATKGEMYDWIASIGGKCFVNTASEDLVAMARLRDGMQIVPYGAPRMHPDILPQDPEHPFLRMQIEDGGSEYTINTHLVGSYNADNVLAALAVGIEFGVDLQDAISAVEAYEPSNKRSQMIKTERNILVVDAYNANPSSMAAALDNFADMNAPHKAVLLGDMLELGAESAAEHQKVLRRLTALNPEIVVLVGAEFAEAVRQSGAGFMCFDTSTQASEYLESIHIEGFAILVKGSRGTMMEKTLTSL